MNHVIKKYNLREPSCNQCLSVKEIIHNFDDANKLLLSKFNYFYKMK